jgi:CspA family cold shock protein
MIGTLKWYNRVKGYGFITSEGRDIFFHHSAILLDRNGKEHLEGEEGKRLEFQEVRGERGAKAINIKPIEG